MAGRIEFDGKSDHDLMVEMVTTLNGFNEKLDNVCKLVDTVHVGWRILQSEHNQVMREGGHEQEHKNTMVEEKQTLSSISTIKILGASSGGGSIILILYLIARGLLSKLGIDI